VRFRRDVPLTGAIAVMLATLIVADRRTKAEDAGAMPLYVFCGTGDHLWTCDREPVDSPAAVTAMMEWLAKTYGVRRLYWRGGQSMMWDKHHKVGKEKPLQYDWFLWKRHLYNDLRINEAAIAAAKRYGMEVFLYTGLFEFGVQPDIGIVGPYLFEDELCIEHPEWRPLDRWLERRCPGAICFGYPEVRRILVMRYLDNIERFGYDGINFYTYVENCGIRYKDAFGFNQPIAREFNKRYPNVDLRRDALTDEQERYWYKCRGKFVTDFLRELHAALAPRGKKISVILDAKDPDYAQPWWGKPIPGTGMIYMDWRRWVREGIVDEIWVQLAEVTAQQRTLDLLLRECKGTSVRLTVRAVNPFAPVWKPYLAAGVTPVAVITAPHNGIERFSLEPTSLAGLQSPDWRLRLQTLADIEQGRLRVDASRVAALAEDAHVLVRRRVMRALAALGATDKAAVIERGLFDSESCVRIAAAAALARVNGPQSPQRILAALEKDGYFQMKMACVDALSAMKQRALPTLVTGMRSRVYAVREVCTRALGRIGYGGLANSVYDPLRSAMLDQKEDERVRYYAMEWLVSCRLKLDAARQQQLGADLIALAGGERSTMVQLWAAWGLGYMSSLLPSALHKQALDTLAEGFRRYGDGCRRADAAFGWRVFGNALLQFGRAGRERLERMRTQKRDKWLAWLAYEVAHMPHRWMKMQLIDERAAVEDHEKYAPVFPGYRRW